MRLLSLWELRCCSRAELFGYLDWILAELNFLQEGSSEFQTAQTNLRNIRWVLVHDARRPSCHP